MWTEKTWSRIALTDIRCQLQDFPMYPFGALQCGKGGDLLRRKASKGSGCDGFVGGKESDAMKFYYDGQITSSFRQFACKFVKINCLWMFTLKFLGFITHTQRLTRQNSLPRLPRIYDKFLKWREHITWTWLEAFFLAPSIFCFSEVFCGKLETFWPFYRSDDTESTTWDNIIKHLSDSRRSIMSVHSLLQHKVPKETIFPPISVNINFPSLIYR